MIAFPNIKINLGLSITEKRPDGYHNLETVFYPVALEDALEIRTSPNADRKFTLHQHGMEIAGNPEDNLVVKDKATSHIYNVQSYYKEVKCKRI